MSMDQLGSRQERRKFIPHPSGSGTIWRGAAPDQVGAAATMLSPLNNTSNTRRWATNAGSRKARHYGEARNPDAGNTDGHGHARISAHDAFVRLVLGDSGRHKHQRANYSRDEANSV
jgi:hypothetical protein